MAHFDPVWTGGATDDKIRDSARAWNVSLAESVGKIRSENEQAVALAIVISRRARDVHTSKIGARRVYIDTDSASVGEGDGRQPIRTRRSGPDFRDGHFKHASGHASGSEISDSQPARNRAKVIRQGSA